MIEATVTAAAVCGVGAALALALTLVVREVVDAVRDWRG
jgi:hypothetical protein